ncbi:hypothetical protein GEMRC1_003925 [Eukaryota sp. GEM-RC1]
MSSSSRTSSPASAELIQRTNLSSLRRQDPKLAEIIQKVNVFHFEMDPTSQCWRNKKGISNQIGVLLLYRRLDDSHPFAFTIRERMNNMWDPAIELLDLNRDFVQLDDHCIQYISVTGNLRLLYLKEPSDVTSLLSTFEQYSSHANLDLRTPAPAVVSQPKPQSKPHPVSHTQSEKKKTPKSPIAQPIRAATSFNNEPRSLPVHTTWVPKPRVNKSHVTPPSNVPPVEKDDSSCETRPIVTVTAPTQTEDVRTQLSKLLKSPMFGIGFSRLLHDRIQT